MAKRIFDIVFSALGLLATSPLLGVIMVMVWRQDGYSPFYFGERVARNFGAFRIVKMRSMVKNADRSGVESTGASDNRITPLGHFIRRYKIDELTQLWNVLTGEMSIVGPRPNTRNGVAAYTPLERRILTVRPGITDISSIVFSDEGDILKDQPDPDLAYDELIRPWKSRLCLLYIAHQSFLLDIRLIWLTIIAIVSKPHALAGVQAILQRLHADPVLIAVCQRNQKLVASPLPGT